MANKVDSNVTGLRYAEEVSLRELPVSPVWYGLEPNSYTDFGGQISTVARNPINASRQRKKGVTSDLDASGGFNQDLTFSNTTRLLQGFFFADVREKFTTAPMNSAQVVVTSVDSANSEYTAASGLGGVISGTLLLAEGFSVAANNGLKVADGASTATSIAVTNSLSTEASPPSDATLRAVGHQFEANSIDVSLNDDLVRLERASGAFDMTTLGLIPGEWLYVGGDASASRFSDNVGWARVRAVEEDYIELDKVSWAPAQESGSGISLQVFYGSVLKNEEDPALIKRRTYQIERTLGRDNSGPMSEYLVGAVPNELTLNVAQADKVTIDLTFVAVDNEQRDGSTGLKAGTRPALQIESAYNTSSDIARSRLAIVTDDAAQPPLFAFATEMTLTINNNVTPNKAIAVLGAFDTSAGTFEVGGNMTVYFADVNAVAAVRNNADVTRDILLVKENRALLFDVPLIALGDGRLAVEQDQAITLPLETSAAESVFGHTLLFQSFYYLPDVAVGL